MSMMTMREIVDAEDSGADADQLAWDRFAASALAELIARAPIDYGSIYGLEYQAAQLADAMMLERAKRLTRPPRG